MLAFSLPKHGFNDTLSSGTLLRVPLHPEVFFYDARYKLGLEVFLIEKFSLRARTTVRKLIICGQFHAMQLESVASPFIFSRA
jgi:hypothetical protein